MQTEDKPTLNDLQRCYSSQRHKGNFLKKISFNGWLLPGNSEVGVLHPYDAPFSVFRKKKIELRDSGAGKRRWAARDRKQLFKAIGYCLNILEILFFRYGKVQKEYEKKFEMLKNKSAWN